MTDFGFGEGGTGEGSPIPMGGDLDGWAPNPNVIAVHSGAEQLRVGAILADQMLVRVGDWIVSIPIPAMPSTLPPSGPAGGSLAGTYPNPSIAAGAVGTAEVAAANRDGAAGTPSRSASSSGPRSISCCASVRRRINNPYPRGTAPRTQDRP